MNKKVLLQTGFLALSALLPSLAFAHVGVGGGGGMMHGFLHPFSGLDHVCAMLAVGLWAVQTGGRTVWVMPLSFVGVMALGGALPILGISLPFAEQGIALSVLFLGVLIASSVRLPVWLGSALVGLFALWHGHAHGSEIPALASGIAYSLGFMLATSLLHLVGISFGLTMQRLTRERVVRFAGAVIAFFGLCLAVV